MEIWKDIVEYEGLYQVSNLGNVKSLGNSRNRKEKILKFRENRDNYLQVGLYKDGKAKNYYVHRLVAEAFIPKIEEKTHIDHIDGNRQNNNVNNLRWCTIAENNNFDLARKHKSEALKGRIGGMKGKTGAWKGKTGSLHHNSKSVLCIELNRIFESLSEAERETGVKYTSISKCCLGKYKFAGELNGIKLHWKYAK